MRLRQRVREYAYGMGFGIDEEAEQRVLDGEAGVPGGSLMPGRLLAVQVAKNSWTPDDDIEAVKADYVYCVDAVARYSDIIVVNVSSPNTPGLRGLQRVEPLTNILKGVVEAAKRATKTTKPAVMVKVSPDEDSEEQVRGICDAVWESGVDGVIVGNTTKRRPEPLGALPSREAAVLLEQGGYSGPQLFERTVELTKRYRTLLDEGMQAKPGSPPPPSKAPSLAISTQASPDEDLSARIEATTARDEKNLKPDTPGAEAESKSQPLIRLPERNSLFSSGDSGSSDTPALSASHHVDQLPAAPSQQDSRKGNSRRKVIFATGGITNGKQGKFCIVP
jgi:dihydroorotate dehydrogenase